MVAFALQLLINHIVNSSGKKQTLIDIEPMPNIGGTGQWCHTFTSNIH